MLGSAVKTAKSAGRALKSGAYSATKTATRHDSMVSSANVADAPLSGNAVAAGGAAVAGTYAASTMGESVDSVESPTFQSANPFTFAKNSVESFASSTALSAAGLQMANGESAVTSLGGINTQGSGIMGATAVAGAGAAILGSFDTMSAVAQSTSNTNLFDAPEAKGGRMSRSYMKRQGAALGNAAYRGVTKMGFGAAGVFGAAAAVDIVDETVNRLAKKVMKTGTPGSNLSSNNVLDSQKRTKQTGPTTGVSTFAGKSPNVMDGSTVLALHKTGGSGGVLR